MYWYTHTSIHRSAAASATNTSMTSTELQFAIRAVGVEVLVFVKQLAEHDLSSRHTCGTIVGMDCCSIGGHQRQGRESPRSIVVGCLSTLRACISHRAYKKCTCTQSRTPYQVSLEVCIYQGRRHGIGCNTGDLSMAVRQRATKRQLELRNGQHQAAVVPTHHTPDAGSLNQIERRRAYLLACEPSLDWLNLPTYRPTYPPTCRGRPSTTVIGTRYGMSVHFWPLNSAIDTFHCLERRCRRPWNHVSFFNTSFSPKLRPPHATHHTPHTPTHPPRCQRQLGAAMPRG